MRNMLFLSHRFPWPQNKGERIRASNLLRHFAPNWRIFFGCISDDPADAQHDDAIRPWLAELATFPVDKRRQKLRSLLRFRPGRPLMLDYYGHPGLQAWADGVLARENIDLVYIFSTAMAPYVIPARKRHMILDMQDVDSEKWREYATEAKFPMSLVWSREARTLLAYERQAAAACEATLLVSGPECDRLVQLAPELAGRVHPIEQGVDLTAFNPAAALDTPYKAGPNLVMVGNMDYWPNADGALYFAREVMPLLAARTPAPHFTIVGGNPGPEILALAENPNITVTGRVPDVRPYVLHADAAVAPLRIARGIQNKILEAMALGRPVITTPQGYEGVRAQAGRDLLVGDTPAALAAAVASILDGQHDGIGQRARAAIEASYKWERILGELDEIIEGVLRK